MATQSSLFGFSPEQVMQAREAQAMEAAMAYGKNPMQAARAGMFMAGNTLGSGIGGAMGGVDPEVAKAQALKQLISQYDTTTPEGLAQFAQAVRKVDPNVALQAAQKAQSMAEEKADIDKKRRSVEMDEAMRQELAALGPNPTQEQVLQVAQKYASGDRLLTTIQGSLNARDKSEVQRELLLERLKAQKENLESQFKFKMDFLEKQGAQQVFLEQLRMQHREQMKYLDASLKAAEKDRKEAGEKPEKLTSSDIKQLNDAKQHFKAADNNVNIGREFITKIEKGEIRISPKENLYGAGRTLLGNANPSDVEKASLRQFVERSSAEVLRMDVGVKTEGDAQRAKQQVLDSLGKNDPKVVRQSLDNYVKFLETVKGIHEEKINTISEVRKRPELAAKPKGTKENPIKLD